MPISIQEYKQIIANQTNFKSKNPNRQRQGKINRELGQNFEQQVETIAEMYR